MEGTEYITTLLEKQGDLLESKLTGFAELLRSELRYLKDDVKKIEDTLEAHVCRDGEETMELRQSIVRIHGRIDTIEARLKTVEEPKKLDPWGIIKTKALEWVAPTLIVFAFWFIFSGSAQSFFSFLLKLPTT